MSFQKTIIKDFCFLIPQDAKYFEFDHGNKKYSLHVVFSVNSKKYRFIINNLDVRNSPQQITEETFQINATFSEPEYKIQPYSLKTSNNEGWACGFGKKEKDIYRIHKSFFKNKEEIICLTFTSKDREYDNGFEVYEKILNSFSITDS